MNFDVDFFEVANENVIVEGESGLSPIIARSDEVVCEFSKDTVIMTLAFTCRLRIHLSTR